MMISTQSADSILPLSAVAALANEFVTDDSIDSPL